MTLEERLARLKLRTRWTSAAIGLVLIATLVFIATMVVAHIADQAQTPKPPAKGKALDDHRIADLVESALGERPKVVRSEHFRIVNLGSKDEARELTALAERVHGEFVRLLQDDPGTRYWKGRADEFLCRDWPQYRTLVVKVMPRYVDEKVVVDFFRTVNTAWLATGPFGMSDCSHSSARNAVVHLAGRQLIHNAVGPGRRHGTAWLAAGFGWNMEERFTGSIRIVFFFMHMWDWDPEEARASRGKLEEWSRTMASSEFHGRLMKFAEIKKQVYLNEWDSRSRPHIWALVKFLVEEHPEPFAKWLKLMRRLPLDEAFLQSFGWTDEQVDEHWRPWVRRRFARDFIR